MKKIYKLEILEKEDYGENDFTLGIYSTRELAEEAYNKYKDRQNALIEKWDKQEGFETSPRFEEEHCEYISELILDDMNWGE